MKFNALVQLHWTATSDEKHAIWALVSPIMENRFPDAGPVKVIDMRDGTTAIGFFTADGVVPH